MYTLSQPALNPRKLSATASTPSIPPTDSTKKSVIPSSPSALPGSAAIPDKTYSRSNSKPVNKFIINESVGRQSEYTEGNLQLTEIIEGSNECGEAMCIRFSPDGNLLAAGFNNGTIKMYSLDGGHCLHTLITDDPLRQHLPVTSIRFCPYHPSEHIEHSHMLMATYASGYIRFWHYTSGKIVCTINEHRQSSETSASTFNVLGDKFATVGADPQIHMYDTETKKRTSVLEPTDARDKMDGHRYRVFAIQYHPNEPHIFLTGGWDDTVQFWDDRQRRAFRKFSGPHICGDALDIDPVHGHILTGSWRKDKTLQIWDFGSSQLIKDVPQDVMYASQLYCAQWYGKENIVCAGTAQNMARVIDRGTLNTVGQLVQLPRGVYCMDNDRLGAKPRLAFGAANRLYVCSYTSAK